MKTYEAPPGMVFVPEDHYAQVEKIEREYADVLKLGNRAADVAEKWKAEAESLRAQLADVERERDEARAELRNVDRLRDVRVIRHDGGHFDFKEFVVAIDDDPPHSQWHGSGRTAREALWRACRGKDRAAQDSREG